MHIRPAGGTGEERPAAQGRDDKQELPAAAHHNDTKVGLHISRLVLTWCL
jgi:hypothetical protein